MFGDEFLIARMGSSATDMLVPWGKDLRWKIFMKRELTEWMGKSLVYLEFLMVSD